MIYTYMHPIFITRQSECQREFRIQPRQPTFATKKLALNLGVLTYI